MTVLVGKRFEPTYKELKLRKKHYEEKKQRCFEPTYKELKHICWYVL